MHLPLYASLAVLLSTAHACSTIQGVSHTFYGYPDNDPPGAATSYNCGGRNYEAGGTGTYDDPVTFASAVDEFSICEVVYLPYLQKYARHEDLCATCNGEWHNNTTWHVDVWTGNNKASGDQDQIDCENSLTVDMTHPVVRDPKPDLIVDFSPLYINGMHPSCATDHEYLASEVNDYC